jgi:integrase
VASPEEGGSFMSIEKLFEFGGMWIGRVSGSEQLYRFWYDNRNGEVRRRSLKTKNIEEAKKRLAETVVNDAPTEADDPEKVPLVFVLTHSLEGHADSRPSAHVAKRACELVMQFLERQCGFVDNVNTLQFSIIYQVEFAKWCAKEFLHSHAYVSRILSVVAAACRYAAKTKLIKSASGELRQARLLRYVPEISYNTKWVADIRQVAEPRPRDYVPSFEELASLLDTECGELLRRYDIIALNTWARPEAIVDLNVGQQVDFENELLDLNPPNRRQNKKQRPIIRLTANLRGWLEHWAEDRPLSYDKKSDDGKLERIAARHLKAQFARRSTRWMLRQTGFTQGEIGQLLNLSRKGNSAELNKALESAERKGIQRITRYTLRHFMARRVRGLAETNVGREQRSMWLGHCKRDATSWYETHDIEFLRECFQATTLVIEKLDRLMQRELISPNVRQLNIQSLVHSRRSAGS